MGSSSLDRQPAVLAFDCSTQSCSAAVVRGTEVLAWQFEPMARGQSEALMPMIVAVMEQSGLSWADLSLIGVTVGPGTFTGIRIGLAAARGLALATGLPVAGVGTCEAVAHNVMAEERKGAKVLAVIDSKRTDLFFQLFGETLAPEGAPFAATAEQAWQRNGASGLLLLVGDGAQQMLAVAPTARLAQADRYPDARRVAALALVHHRAGTALRPEAFYLRPPDVTMPAVRRQCAR
jgi:tRNA threonylcarbamoyladenosine biosynthesis protein TsaB